MVRVVPIGASITPGRLAGCRALRMSMEPKPPADSQGAGHKTEVGRKRELIASPSALLHR